MHVRKHAEMVSGAQSFPANSLTASLLSSPNRVAPTGYTDFQTKQLVGRAVVIEVIDAVKNKKLYNQERRLRNLKNLPREPQE